MTRRFHSLGFRLACVGATAVSWVLRPLGGRRGDLQLWRRCGREEIPPLFRLPFSEAVWNATAETRNRKRLMPNSLSAWELRIGELRVYDDVNESPRVVTIRAVGIKDRNRVRIGKRQVSDEDL